MNMTDQKKAVSLIDIRIKRYKSEGLAKILPDCNIFGSPPLNFLYKEIYECCKNGQSLLALAGAGIFMEEFMNLLWVSSRVHQKQLANVFSMWDEVMEFMGTKFEEIEDKKINYKKGIRPTLENILGTDELEDVEVLREFVRNTFVHSKRDYLIKTLQQQGVLPAEMPVAKLDIPTKKISQVELGLTHPLVSQIGFKKLADQIAPAMLIFIYELFKKHHKHLAPLKDQKIGFSGHECEYD